MLTYQRDPAVTPAAVAELYRRAGLNRPVGDLERIGRMIAGANLSFGAFDGDRLVGYARSVTDFSYCCYLSDLAVDPDLQGQGVGRTLIARTQEVLGPEVMLLLVAAPTADSYYPQVGFQRQERAWFVARER